MSTTDRSQSFEQQLTEIEEIVGDLESGALSLDEMLGRYESGMQLIAACQNQLAKAELKVIEITDAVSADTDASDG